MIGERYPMRTTTVTEPRHMSSAACLRDLTAAAGLPDRGPGQGLR